MSNYTLYAADCSLYSAKARAYLNYKKIPYEEVSVTSDIYNSIIEPNTGKKFIPVVKTPTGEYLQDTTNIIDQLEIPFPEKSVYPLTPNQRMVSLLLELYGDEWLLIPAMHYRWNFDENLDSLYECFGNIASPKMPGFIKKIAGKNIAKRISRWAPRLGVTQKTIPAIEQWYESKFLIALNAHFSEYSYLLGNIPCIADFSFYGPLYTHLYQDQYPKKIMQENAPNVVAWLERMTNAAEVEGEFLDEDEIPDTLIPILNNLFDEQWPVLEDTANRVSEWYSRETNDIKLSEPIEIPRRMGTQKFIFNQVEDERSVQPHSQWMMQRPLNFYHSLSAKEKKVMEPLLKRVNGLYAMRFDLSQQVTRLNNQFVII